MSWCKSYPAVGDLAIPLALLPLWKHCYRCESPCRFSLHFYEIREMPIHVESLENWSRFYWLFSLFFETENHEKLAYKWNEFVDKMFVRCLSFHCIVSFLRFGVYNNYCWVWFSILIVFRRDFPLLVFLFVLYLISMNNRSSFRDTGLSFPLNIRMHVTVLHHSTSSTKCLRLATHNLDGPMPYTG